MVSCLGEYILTEVNRRRRGRSLLGFVGWN